MTDATHPHLRAKDDNPPDMLRRMDKHQSKLLLCGRDEMLVFDMGKLGNPWKLTQQFVLIRPTDDRKDLSDTSF